MLIFRSIREPEEYLLCILEKKRLSYAAIARETHIFKDDHIMERVKENLEIIGKVYEL